MSNTAKSMISRESEEATFAGGCFWCMEGPFETHLGVIDVVAGYTGGHIENPTYEQVCSGKSGHIEAIRVLFDPQLVTYVELLDIFWRQIDPTDAGGQFADRGTQYISAIFYHSDEQKKEAEESKKRLEESGVFKEKIATVIKPVGEFYKAEDYHQDYYKNNKIKYKAYRIGSGREIFLKKTWKE